ncbi:AAEL002686-PA [Aedes aegypti]|uniref:AAEL002686-PA n=2 Tax=Aedes aegypti TaxID=7159 RepID=A0A1S4F2G9_AEDAE|nr:testisin [Aedes aegypti]EAT46099.1 AAEL002686-PA [Aedes aegypti]
MSISKGCIALLITGCVFFALLNTSVAQLSNPQIVKPKCGKRLVEPLQPQETSNGKRPKIEQWPWVGTLFIRYGNDEPVFACVVTILNDRFVLTAGYCLTSGRAKVTPPDLMVRLRMDSFDRKEQKSIHEFDVGEFYLSNATDSLAALALLMLSSEINLNVFARPICLWDRDEGVVGRNGTLLGWKSNLFGGMEQNMRELNVAVVPSDMCPMLPQFMVGKMCTKVLGELTFGHGDGGGGLYLEEEGVWYVRGIIVKFDVIGLEQQYLSFIDISSQLKWIKQIIE